MMLSLHLDFSFPVCQDSGENPKVVPSAGATASGLQTQALRPHRYRPGRRHRQTGAGICPSSPCGSGLKDGVLVPVRTLSLAAFY